LLKWDLEVLSIGGGDEFEVHRLTRSRICLLDRDIGQQGNALARIQGDRWSVSAFDRD
jgi:hypothetical protein